MVDETSSNPTRWWHDRRKLAAAIVAGVLAVAGVATAAYFALKRPDDVSNPNAVFKEEPQPKPIAETTDGGMFGFERARPRYSPTNKVHPPYNRIWKYGANPLLEFPPIFVRLP